MLALTNYFPRPRTKHRARTFFFRSQERNTDLEGFFPEAKNETPTWNYFFPGFLNWKCYFFFVLLGRRCTSELPGNRLDTEATEPPPSATNPRTGTLGTAPTGSGALGPRF